MRISDWSSDVCSSDLFDEIFDFDRGIKETLAYANTIKNGSVAQRAQLHVLEKVHQASSKALPLIQELGKGVTQGVFESVTSLLESPLKTTGKLLDILLEQTSSTENAPDPVEVDETRRRKKRQQQNRG